MKVSVITVCYNSAKYLPATIESVLCQDYGNIEYVVVDGLSNDGTIDIIKSYEAKFCGRMKWVSEKDSGLYDAMNKGIRIATGDIVGILNSDDMFIDEHVITDVVNVFEKENVDSLYGNLVFVAPNNPEKIIRKWVSSNFQYGQFVKGWHPPHPTFFVKREIYERYGVFDTNIAISADFELMLRLLEKEKISTIYINRYFVKMRYGGESTGSLQKILIGNRNVIKAFKKNNIPLSFFYPVYRIFPKFAQYIRK